MATVLRKPYQGLGNVVRFNWHFYLIAAVSVSILSVLAIVSEGYLSWISLGLSVGILVSIFFSLFVSHLIYDRSDLYAFSFLNEFVSLGIRNVVNINAGFDETSVILKEFFPNVNLRVFDFYDPTKHTEVSIVRARKAYPPVEGTVKITTKELPVQSKSVDIIFNILALHEIRLRKERIDFLKMQVSALAGDGRIIVIEHRRDLANFLAFNVGCFHFFSSREWFNNYCEAGLSIEKQFKITPFITVDILRKANGNTP